MMIQLFSLFIDNQHIGIKLGLMNINFELVYMWNWTNKNTAVYISIIRHNVTGNVEKSYRSFTTQSTDSSWEYFQNFELDVVFTEMYTPEYKDSINWKCLWLCDTRIYLSKRRLNRILYSDYFIFLKSFYYTQSEFWRDLFRLVSS